MRLIDADKLVLYLNDWAFGIAPSEYDDNETKKYTVRDLRGKIYKTLNECMQTIDERPTIEAEPIVRCKDCKHSYDAVGGTFCSYGVCVDCIVDVDFFCKNGEPREVKE